MYKCSAGICGIEADHIHQQLNTPLCGKCYKSSNEAIFHNGQRQQLEHEENNNPIINNKKYEDTDDVDVCIWCGNSDGIDLFICDTCPAVYCEKCCYFNFTKSIVQEIRDAEPWSCFICHPTQYFIKKQVPPGVILLNLDCAYEQIKPPCPHIDIDNLRTNLQENELKLASLFCDFATNTSLVHLEIFQYLTVHDLPHLYVLNKNLRHFFTTYFMPIPALFRTQFGKENNCRLHQHQINSLCRMKELENLSTEFGALRGGILGDEPGLGKTVTVLGLILSTTGTIPTQPALFWNNTDLDLSWQALRNTYPDYKDRIQPVLNGIRKGFHWRIPEYDQFVNNYYHKPTRQSECALPHTVKEFESQVRTCVRTLPGLLHKDKDRVLESFRLDMLKLRASLEKSRRSKLKSQQGKRILFERSLRPSSATLIVVPLALLEHWYEQIIRHIGFEYLTPYEDEEEEYKDNGNNSNNDYTTTQNEEGEEEGKKKKVIKRGIVYLDGIGDIADVQVPLNKLQIISNMSISAEILAHYLIVITTFERCHQQFDITNKLNNRYSSTNINSKSFESSIYRDKDTVLLDPTCYTKIPLLQIRWLRLIVDEGHELGTVDTPSDSTLFISEIAAERRWVMSGTPTSALNSKIGLNQLQRLLQFLRHKQYGIGYEGIQNWHKDIVYPFCQHDKHAMNNLVLLLKTIMVRHQKSDIHLHAPIYNTIVLDQVIDSRDTGRIDEKARRVDRAISQYIVGKLNHAKQMHKQYQRLSFSKQTSPIFSRNTLNSSTNNNNNKEEVVKYHRRPKFIVFSERFHYLQGVGTFFYVGLGDQSVCEHYGIYRSIELSRFRHSKRTFRICPLCGHKNGTQCTSGCERTLLRVIYDVPTTNPLSPVGSMSVPVPEPEYIASPSGHSYYGPGGHFDSPCLCNDTGPHNCTGYPNALKGEGFHEAIVAEEHVLGYERGLNLAVGQRVYIQRASPNENINNSLLWKHGRLGGWATLIEWKKCGGKQPCWHGSRIFPHLDWKVEDEDASIMLLCADGSHGLDLSFVTDIFLLERLKDKALQEQIISRANRMGATAPVTVTTVLVRANDDDEHEDDDNN